MTWRAAGLSTPRTQMRLVLAHAVLMQVVTTVARPSISYRAIELGVHPMYLGVIASSYTVVPLFLALVVGRVTDRRGEQVVVVLGSVLMLTSMGLVLGAGAGVAVLVAGSVLLGLGQLLSMVGEQSLVAGLAGGRGFDLAFGRFTFATSIGQLVGPGIVSVLGGSATLPATGDLFTASLVAATIMVLLSVAISSRPRSPGEQTAPQRPVRAALHVSGLGIAIVASLSVIAVTDMLAVYLPVLGTERGISASVVGALLMVRAGSSMVSRMFLGYLVTHHGRARSLIGSLAVATVAIALVAIDLPVQVLVLVVVLAGLGLGLSQPLTLAWIAEASPPSVRATALSLRLTGNRLGQTVLPAGAGLLAAGSGVAGVFCAMAGSLALSALLSARGSIPEPAPVPLISSPRGESPTGCTEGRS